jgi:hypothetical protein
VCFHFVVASSCHLRISELVARAGPDGSIVITHRGALPKGAEPTGTIRCAASRLLFGLLSVSFRYFAEGKVVKEEKLKLRNSEGTTPHTEFELSQVVRPCQLGTNL